MLATVGSLFFSSCQCFKMNPNLNMKKKKENLKILQLEFKLIPYNTSLYSHDRFSFSNSFTYVKLYKSKCLSWFWEFSIWSQTISNFWLDSKSMRINSTNLFFAHSDFCLSFYFICRRWQVLTSIDKSFLAIFVATLFSDSCTKVSISWINGIYLYNCSCTHSSFVL